ncbi:NUDIX hydrolase [Echinicola rosea]|uniref:NUDIX hydrolase n=1 Tax=Echinicola rosea TaxID=1807691 RepID=A0ABQ1UYL4_9BACT|nr:NUDIX hydrolase [Echinicola rosea]GGF30659.1 NUDIX hydrolase [Echinicola rosea]
MTAIPECFYRISVKALIFDEQGRFLLIREDNGMWDLPGGGLDHEESAEQGIEREMLEEMGIKPSFIAPHPSFFFSFSNPKGLPAANIIYRARISHHHFRPSTECEALRYFHPADIGDVKVYPNIPILIGLLQA